MHKIALTETEELGLTTHRLPIGKPSQLSDCFRLGVKWQKDNSKEVEKVKSALSELEGQINKDNELKTVTINLGEFNNISKLISAL
jgi:hypothetical protein